MNCLILAAGRNTRLDTGIPKSLVTINGESLLSRHIRIFKSVGVRKFCVISGYRAERIEEALPAIAAQHDVEITLSHNDRYDLENGYSVYAANEWAQTLNGEDFFLTMGDHIFQQEFVKEFSNVSNDRPFSLQLAVDKPGDTNRHIDIDDVTKVLVEEKQWIESIGKQIETYNYYDTGLFRLKNTVFDVLKSCFEKEKYTISDMVTSLISAKDAVAVPVSGFTWNDVDNPDDLQNTRGLMHELDSQVLIDIK